MLDPTLNKNAAAEVFSGMLLKTGVGGMTKYNFKYSIVYGRKYQATASTMPLGYVAVAETIRTTDALLPFAKGDKVTLVGGNTMTVQAVEEYRNPALVSMGINQVENLTITLEGGGK